jgi:hypothetical protein
VDKAISATKIFVVENVAAYIFLTNFQEQLQDKSLATDLSQNGPRIFVTGTGGTAWITDPAEALSLALRVRQ